jgi:AraC family transcriptional regulator
MTATPSRSIQKMSEQLNVVDLNFDNTIIHSCINTFQKEVKDSGLSIKLAHKGDEHYFFKNQRLSISPGEYLLVNRHQSFDCYLNAPQAIEGFCLYLSKNTILDTVKGVRSSQHQLLDYWGEQGEQEPLFLEKVYRTDEDELGQYLEQIRPLLVHHQLEDMDTFFYTLAEKLLISQSRINQQVNNISAAKRSTREELFRRLSYAKTYIHDNFQKDIQLEELSRAAMLSKYHLLRSYREAFGITPYRQVLELRLQHAAMRLNDDEKLEDIALSLGFSDRRSFTKAFKKRYGCAPSLFRNQLSSRKIAL